MPFKRPISVLVVIHTQELNVLLLERATHANFWQSVTGSQEEGESLLETARREVLEETGLDYPHSAFLDWQQQNEYEIFAGWQHRYAPNVTRNVEHVFSLALPKQEAIKLAPEEHVASVWLPWQHAAPLCFSASNQEAILALPKRLGFA